jgi:hypothetical protein
MSFFKTKQPKKKFLSDFVFEIQQFALLHTPITLQLVDLDNGSEIVFKTVG